MRSSLVGLQLLLACVLVWGTSVAEEKKECCGPGVPPEKSCCPKGNSTSQEPEKPEEQPVVPTEPNSEGPKSQGKQPEEPTPEELEERRKEYLEMIEKRGRYDYRFLKQKVLAYMFKHKNDAFYRPIEDIDVNIKSAVGTIVSFTQFLVRTNCTKEEGRKFSSSWFGLPPAELVHCVALPKLEQKILKCRVTMFLDAGRRHSTVLWQKCEPVVFFDGSEDDSDFNYLLNFPAEEFEPSF